MLMDNELQQAYNKFEQRWKNLHPISQSNVRDKFLYNLQIAVIIGAIILSGSRTGNAVASIGSLVTLAENANYFGLTSAFWKGAEAFITFITIEGALLLAGYLTGDHQSKDKRWYWILFSIAFTASLFSNVLPAWEAIESYVPSIMGSGKIIVNVVIGLVAPIMVFVAGRTLGVIRNDMLTQQERKALEYENRKAKAWSSSTEYRAYKKSQEQEEQKQEEPIIEEKEIEPDLSNNGRDGNEIINFIRSHRVTSVNELAYSFEMPKDEMLGKLKELETANLLEMNGTQITLKS
jgi:hypothetical protein